MSFCSFLLLLIIVATTTTINALSTATTPKPRGCAAAPLDKKKIAVCGAGGYLGAVTFGFLQRASSLYGTGMGGGASSPRNICATAMGSKLLNGVLSKNFVLAYAGEDQMRLTNAVEGNVEDIARRLTGYKGVILGTMNHLEQRPVTPGSYGKTPNDKAYEFYLDRPKRILKDVTLDNDEMVELNLKLFSNLVQACRQAEVEHVVVVETPATTQPLAFAAVLQEKCKVPFTYVRLDGELNIFPNDYTYLKGLQGNVEVTSNVIQDDDNWMAQLDPPKSTSSTPLYYEDLAAVLVQSLQSLDWSTSRCLRVCSRGPLEGARTGVTGRHDREWCGNQQVLAERFTGLLA